jgi:hypothetical protein
MPSKTYINKFSEGLDKDSDDKIRKNTTYKDAYHVELSGDSKYGAIQNIKGSSLVDTILSTVTYSNINVMGAFKARTYIVSDTDVEDCVYIFYIKNVSSVYTFVIDLFRPSNNTTYNIFSSVESSSMMSASVDAFVIGEGGVDTLYFTTNILPPGRIRCVLDSTPLITERQQELFKRYPQHPLVISNIIYNPKSESAASDSHIVNLETISNPAGGDEWEGKIVLDNDTQSGDQFRLFLDWDLSIDTTDVDALARIEIQVWNGATYQALSGFPKQLYDDTQGGPQSDGGSETIDITYNPYLANPVLIDLITDAGGVLDDIGVASVEITNIQELAGGDNYSLGTFLFKEVDSD